MKKRLKKILNRILIAIGVARKARLYIGDGWGGQKKIETYDDYEVIGRWGIIDEDGKPEEDPLKKGDLLSRSVKYVDSDGEVCIGREWVPDNDKSVVGFDPNSKYG